MQRGGITVSSYRAPRRRPAPTFGTVVALTPLRIHTDGDPVTDLFPVYYVGAAPTVGARVRWTLEDRTLIIYVLTPA